MLSQLKEKFENIKENFGSNQNFSIGFIALILFIVLAVSLVGFGMSESK